MFTPIKSEKGEGLISVLISIVFGIVITFVALRFVFGIFNVSPLNSFAGWVYDVSQPLVMPFFKLLGDEINTLAGSFELATLVALIVYSLIGGVLMRVFAGLRA